MAKNDGKDKRNRTARRGSRSGQRPRSSTGRLKPPVAAAPGFEVICATCTAIHEIVGLTEAADPDRLGLECSSCGVVMNLNGQPATRARSGGNIVAELERLADLRARGVLSDAELATLKERLLSGG